MRAAGYAVRVLPREDLGWEENPPTLLEFIRRDLRWCQGNMQYWRFLSLPGLKPVSRYQLALAILMFIGSPAWIGLLVLGTLAVAFSDTPANFIRPDAGMALFVCVLVMWFSPKIASAVEILLRPELRRGFGGAGLFILNYLIETVYSILLCPILWFGHTIFLVGLLFGREIGWIGQTRDDHAVPFTLALHNLWPHTLLGWAMLGLLAMTQPAAIPYALFLAGGPALAVPFAMMTAWPRFGSFTPDWHWPAARGDDEAGRAVAARIARDRVGDAVATAKFGLKAVFEGFRTARGIIRSLRIYYGDRSRAAAMDRLYRGFRQAWRARVRYRRPCRRPRGVVPPARRARGRGRAAAGAGQAAQTVLRAQCRCRDRAGGDRPQRRHDRAEAQHRQSDVFRPRRASFAPPTVRAAGRGRRWTRACTVPVTTLDDLIARHGVPAFIKIDVEGFEAEALAGLTRPVAALSFEFTTIQRDVALACIERCAALGLRASMPRSARARRSSMDAGSPRVRLRAGLPTCRTMRTRETSMPRWSEVRRMRRVLSALAALGLICAGSSARAADDLAVDVVNASEPTLCAEKDNVYLKLVSPEVRRFTIEAVHPAYMGTIVVDRWAPDFRNCDMSNDPVYRFTPRRVTLYETPEWQLIGFTFPSFWRPNQVPVRVGDRVETGLHLLQLWTRYQERAEEVLVLYPADGYWRARPLPPANLRWSAYGSSFLIGPIETEERPFVDISEVAFDPATRTLRLTFRRGGAATLRLEDARPGTDRAGRRPRRAGFGGTPVRGAALDVRDRGECRRRPGRLARQGRAGVAPGAGHELYPRERRRAVGGTIRPSRHNTSAPDMLFRDFRAGP